MGIYRQRPFRDLLNNYKQFSSGTMNKILFRFLTRSFLGRKLSDKTYLSLLYRGKIGRCLDLQNPRSFTEKIQWLKLNWRNEILTQCADKYEVRKFVKERIGPEILKELYGVYEKPEDIDINKLPDSFVLKVNHGCGQNIFCREKSRLDWKHSLRRLKKHYKENLYHTYREWAYKDIVPRIICEEYLKKHGETLYEYGFYCYDGVPHLVEINKEKDGLKRVNMFDIDLNLLENKYAAPSLDEPVARTPQFDRMLEYAVALSKGFPFVRVDLIYTNNRIYFGEMTFYPLAGILKISPESFDYFLGSFLQLPNEE
jgi:hypothetical protein